MISWDSNESHVFWNPTISIEKHEHELVNLLDGHVWFTTSGTTRRGRRWVALSKQALLCSAKAVNKHLQVSRQDRWLLALPTFHVGGIGVLARAFLSGSEVTALSDWSPHDFAAKASAHQATLSSLVPTQIFDLVRAGVHAPSSLRAVVIGGGALPAEIYEQARKLNWRLLPSFGMTECASQIATAPISSLDESGFPELEILSHVRCRVDSDSRLELKSDALLTTYAEWQEPRWNLFDPKQNNWFKSEDRVEIKKNQLRPMGRVTEQIKVLGELVDLARLEESLQALLVTLRLPVRATLMSRPHSRLQTQIDLVVSSNDGANGYLVGERLKTAFDEAVLPFERTQNLYVVDKIPQTALGKIARMELLDHLGF